MSDQENKSNKLEVEVPNKAPGTVHPADAQQSNGKPVEAKQAVDPHAEVVAEQSPELEAAHEEIAKLKDAFLRAKAEADNVRRRTEKEVANSRKFAVEAFAKEMVNVYDSLKLACTVDLPADADESVKNIHAGVEITLKQLKSVFAKFALTEILPQVGDKLDPNIHQAMSIIEVDEPASGCIVNVIQPGFQMHERLLRPAMVVVAK